MTTINGSTSSSNWTYKLEVDEISTNVENNTSQVRVRGYLGRPSGNGGYGYSGDYNYIVQIDDSSEHKRSDSRYQSEGAIAGGGWSSQALFDETFTIKHNTDGTKTIKVYAEMTTSNFSPSSATATGSVVLSQLHKAPNITSVSMSESNTQLSGLGVANDTIVQYLSNKKITINTSTYDNATIKNYSIYHNNVLIGTSTTNEIAANFASVAELMDSGTGSVGLLVAVTDSLGGYSTKIFNFPVIKYTRPSIEFTSTNIRRKTGNGTVLTDNKVSLNFVGTCYKGNDVIGNANKPTVQYKIWNNTEPNYSTLTTPNTVNVTIKDFEISNIEYTEVYDYKIKIYDVFTTTESSINLKTDKVPTGVSVWTEYKDRVDFIKATIGGTTVVDSGSNENGSWVKFYDGTMKCRNTKAFEVTATNALGSALYYGYVADIGDFPQSFVDRPDINFSLHTGSDIFAIQPYDISSVTKENAGGVYAICAQQRTSPATIYISYIAIGKWK